MSSGKYWKVDRKVVTKIDKVGNQNIVTISYKIKFIDSAKFMMSSLLNLVDILENEIHKVKCKDCGCFLKCKTLNENLIKYKCLSCNKNYSNKIGEELKRKTIQEYL